MSRRRKHAPPGAPHPLDFFDRLNWLDGRPLMKTIEPYRRELFTQALFTFDADGRPTYNQVLSGRGKKNWKTSDLSLAALYRFLAWPSSQGNDAFILANDEGQAADDLSLVKKLFVANPGIACDVHPVSTAAKAITRKDGRGSMRVLPAGDATGAHGKSALFLGFDEIWGYKNYDIFEALAPDPTRRDVLTWITSYASIRHAPGIPLFDLFASGKAGTDPRMLFSWYSGDFTTDRKFADKPPEARANPSMKSWDNPDYLAQQKRRLPTHRYRRLHLNLPGAPDGAALSADRVLDAVVLGRTRLPHEMGRKYLAAVDMSGGSSDDAVLAIGYKDENTGRAVLARIEGQTGAPPFNPRHAVRKFASILKDEYRITRVLGDRYAGETFRRDFGDLGITYEIAALPKSEVYEEIEPAFNAREVELLDEAKLQEQLLGLVWRGTKIDHENGAHDDWANAAALVIWRLTAKAQAIPITAPIIMNGAGHWSSAPHLYRPGPTAARDAFIGRSDAWSVPKF